MSLENIVTLDTKMLDKEKLTASYLIGKNEIAVIETGTSSSADITFNEMLKVPYFSPEKVKYIITTHIHMDHSGGAGKLIKRFPNAKIVHHPKTIRHLVDPSRLWDSSYQTNPWTANMYGRPEEISSEDILPAKHGDIFTIDDLELEIIDAPGHHSYHYAILEKESNTIFPGDSCGWYWAKNNIIFPTTPPPRFDYKLYKETIKNHIKAEPSNIAFTHYDVVSENVIEMLYKSLDVTKVWFDLIKEYRQEEINITVKESLNKLIREKYPEFLNLEEGLKGAMIEIPIMGIFMYLDQLEIDPTK